MRVVAAAGDIPGRRDAGAGHSAIIRQFSGRLSIIRSAQVYPVGLAVHGGFGGHRNGSKSAGVQLLRIGLQTGKCVVVMSLL